MTDLIPADLQPALTNVTGQLDTRSKRVYKSDVKFFATWLKDKGLTPDEVTRSDVIAYRAHLAERINPRTGKPYANATAQRMFSVARRVLREQVHTGKLAKNPTEDIRGFKTEDETTHIALTKSEARDLIDAIDQSTLMGKRDYAIMLILLRTGLRRFECAPLTIGDLQKEQGHAIAIIQKGKGGKRTIVKIPTDVLRAIQDYIEATGRQNSPLGAPLFVGFDRGDHPTEKQVSEKLIERMVAHYGGKVGLPGLTPHDLRSTFITLALEAGVPLQQVQYAARHRDPRTTERYQKRKINLDDNAVDYVKF